MNNRETDMLARDIMYQVNRMDLETFMLAHWTHSSLDFTNAVNNKKACHYTHYRREGRTKASMLFHMDLVFNHNEIEKNVVYRYSKYLHGLPVKLCFTLLDDYIFRVVITFTTHGGKIY